MIELNGGSGERSGLLVVNGILNNNGRIIANGGVGSTSGIVANYGTTTNACGATITGPLIVFRGTVNNAPCSPEDLLADLMTAVEAQGLPTNPEKQLLKKLNDAADKLADGKTNAAIGKLNGFIGQVNDKLEIWQYFF